MKGGLGCTKWPLEADSPYDLLMPIVSRSAPRARASPVYYYHTMLNIIRQYSKLQLADVPRYLC